VYQSHYHPEEVSTRKLTSAQADLLWRVVKSSGGGVSSYGEPDSVIAGLMRRHLVQGKAGQPWMIVHTRAGLDWVRAQESK
jgi:hypothetical protein